MKCRMQQQYSHARMIATFFCMLTQCELWNRASDRTMRDPTLKLTVRMTTARAILLDTSVGMNLKFIYIYLLRYRRVNRRDRKIKLDTSCSSNGKMRWRKTTVCLHESPNTEAVPLHAPTKATANDLKETWISRRE